MAKWISRGVAPVVQAMVRGNLPAPEQGELVRQLCASLAGHLPEYVVGGMVLELLQVDLQAGGALWDTVGHRRAMQGPGKCWALLAAT